MELLTESDIRNIILMKNKINLIKEDLSNFEIFSDLNTILNSLEKAPSSWKKECREELYVLEMIQDSIVDGSILRWQGNYKEDARKSILKLKKLNYIIINEYLKKSDPKISEKAIKIDPNWFVCPKCRDAWELNPLTPMIMCPSCNAILQTY